MEVHWFPGHMAKAKREIAANLKLVDIVLEVRDARIPDSSANPDLAGLVANKTRLILLNKADLADPASTRKWLAWLEQKHPDITAVSIDSRSGEGFTPLFHVLREKSRELGRRLGEKGRLSRNLRVLVAGIPNVGKSTVLNRLAGRKAARTGDIPGVTRGKQWVRMAEGLEILDSPGLLPPRIGDRESGIRLAMVGTIPEELINMEELAGELLVFLGQHYPAGLRERFGLADFDTLPDQLLTTAAQKKGCLMAGGRPDLLRAARMIMDEYRSGKLGRITLEHPPHGAPSPQSS